MCTAWYKITNTYTNFDGLFFQKKVSIFRGFSWNFIPIFQKFYGVLCANIRKFGISQKHRPNIILGYFCRKLSPRLGLSGEKQPDRATHPWTHLYVSTHWRSNGRRKHPNNDPHPDWTLNSLVISRPSSKYSVCKHECSWHLLN